MNSTTRDRNAVRHDIQVGELVALASKASGAIGVDVDDACVPPMSKDGPMQLRSVIRGIFGGRSVARGASISSVGDKDAMQPHTPSSHADSYTGELAEPGTPLQQPPGSANLQSTPVLPPRRDGASVGAPGAGASSVPYVVGTPFASAAQSITASGQLSESSMVVVPTPRGSAEHGALSQVRSSCSNYLLLHS